MTPPDRPHNVTVRRTDSGLFRWYWSVDGIGYGLAFTRGQARKKAARAILRADQALRTSWTREEAERVLRPSTFRERETARQNSETWG